MSKIVGGKPGILMNSFIMAIYGIIFKRLIIVKFVEIKKMRLSFQVLY